jgi:8-oxo-dGTP pyrophosphatase MutT (NUDIX family)
MKARAAVILIENDKIALIERHRSGTHYFVFPGGKVKANESLIEAAAREAEEEIGLKVKIGSMVAKVWYLGSPQYFYLAEAIGGQFGHGFGPEMSSTPYSEKGSYLPVWVEVNLLPDKPIYPRILAEFVRKSYAEGWPEKPLYVTDQTTDEMLD